MLIAVVNNSLVTKQSMTLKLNLKVCHHTSLTVCHLADFLHAISNGGFL